jgi:hypothetical protein
VQTIKYGNWDAIHIVNFTINGSKADYKVISTVMITMETNMPLLGKMTVAGSCAKTANQTVTLPADFATNSDAHHLRVIGKIIENNEGILRTEVTDNYINKQRQIINSGRLVEEYMNSDAKKKFQQELAEAQSKMASSKI